MIMFYAQFEQQIQEQLMPTQRDKKKCIFMWNVFSTMYFISHELKIIVMGRRADSGYGFMCIVDMQKTTTTTTKKLFYICISERANEYFFIIVVKNSNEYGCNSFKVIVGKVFGSNPSTLIFFCVHKVRLIGFSPPSLVRVSCVQYSSWLHILSLSLGCVPRAHTRTSTHLNCISQSCHSSFPYPLPIHSIIYHSHSMYMTVRVQLLSEKKSRRRFFLCDLNRFCFIQAN